MVAGPRKGMAAVHLLQSGRACQMREETTMDRKCTRHPLESIPTKREIIRTDEGAEAEEEEVVRGDLEEEEAAVVEEDQDVVEAAGARGSGSTTIDDIKRFFSTFFVSPAILCPSGITNYSFLYIPAYSMPLSRNWATILAISQTR